MPSTWEDTPFTTIEEAATFARNFLRAEPKPVDKPGYLAFVVDDGSVRTLIAQVLGSDGQPVGKVKQLVLREAPSTPGRRKRKRVYGGRKGAGGPPQFGLQRMKPTSALCTPTLTDQIIKLEYEVERLTKLLQSRQVAPGHDTGRGQEPPDEGGLQSPRQVGVGGDCISTTEGGDTK